MIHWINIQSGRKNVQRIISRRLFSEKVGQKMS